MPEVLEISSDEEEGVKDGSKNTDFEWIQELLFNSDDESDGGSDDVVFIHENKAPEGKSKSSTLSVKNDVVDDDDDCVVLEEDPENGVTSVDEEDATGSDELVVVGEKGQVCSLSLFSTINKWYLYACCIIKPKSLRCFLGKLRF